MARADRVRGEDSKVAWARDVRRTIKIGVKTGRRVGGRVGLRR